MASDILTQLQTCYDQLLTQFFATISYLSQRHPLIAPEPVPGDPYTNPPPSIPGLDPKSSTRLRYTSMPPGSEDTDRSMYPLQPKHPSTFALAQKDLAEDLVRKGQQIEHLISRLPGIGKREEEQAQQIKRLIEKVQKMEQLRKQKRHELRECAQKLDEVIMGMGRSINGDDLKVR